MTGAVGLTRRGRGVVLGGCALLLTGLVTDNPVALAAGVFALAVCGSALAWVSVRRRGVRISRMAPPGTSAVGSELTTIATIAVGRTGFGPALVRNLIPLGAADDAGAGLAIVRLDRSEVLVRRACVPRRRGFLAWPVVVVELPDPLGIAVAQRRSAGSGRTLVFPRTVSLGPGLARAGGGDRGPHRSPSRLRPADPGPVPRAYQTGDEFRRMHWPATARAGDPMVRADEPQAVRSALIAIDCSPAGYRDPEAFERAVTACASISERLLEQGWSISLRTAQGTQLADPPGLLGSILAALAVLQLDSSDAVAARAWPSSGEAVIAIRGARGAGLQPSWISLCTEAPDGDVGPGTLIWDGTVPLSSVWARASERVIA